MLRRPEPSAIYILQFVSLYVPDEASLIFKRNSKVCLLASRINTLYVEYRIAACRSFLHKVLQVFDCLHGTVVDTPDNESLGNACILELARVHLQNFKT